MYIVNLKKMARRERLPQSAFQTKPFQGRGATLHPTKGWRSRNLIRSQLFGMLIQHLDHLKQQSVHRMMVAREEREKQRARK